MTTLELNITDPYITGYFVEFAETGEILLLRRKMEFTGDEKDDWYTVRANERLDLIAWNCYKPKIVNASKLWWVIADANNIHNPFDLSSYIGKQLLIPALEKFLLRT